MPDEIKPPNHKASTKDDSVQPPPATDSSKESAFNITKVLEIGAGLLVGLALIVIGYFQYAVYSQQAGIMQAEHRPWVSAYPIELVGDMTHDDSGLNMTVRFPMKNTGHSPARRAFPGFIATLMPFADNTRRQACENADSKLLGVAIFPGDTIIQDIRGLIPESEFTALNAGKFPSVGSAIVIACIAYRDMETTEVHYTPYVFALAISNNPSIAPLATIKDQGKITAGSVIFRALPIQASPN